MYLKLKRMEKSMNNKIEEIKITITSYIPKLKNGIIEAAEFFQKYEENKGTALLVEITDGVKWVIDALVSIQRLDEKEIININNKLNEIIDALENEDYILIGDLLQYELLPVMEEIDNNLV
jgi:hypothetical protein